ncbi:MAG: protein kinase [Deltaproteobacteria bacterium]|nr:protein kinase [Deltaproteobacteria bacterium]
MQAFVDGELSETEIAELSEHLDTCDDCRTLVGVVQPVRLDDATAADTIGRYVLRRVLGQGGMGVVYEAVDPELHRVVALKVLRSDLGREQRRLLGEAQAMAKLAHPNVVTIHDVGRTAPPDERVYIVMALVDGVSLRHWLARSERTLPEMLDAFEQAAEGLRAAHAAGLVHRDFKPENVFVGADGRVLVGDFGLAMPLEGDGATNTAEGSLAYMAPEQRKGDKVDARSDQYAFAVALREALRDRAAVPSWLRRVLERGTRDAPEDRFPTMDAVIEALRAGRTGAKRRRLVAAVTLGLAAAAAAALVWARARDAPDLAPCRARDAEMAAIWSAEVSARTHASFDATRSPLSAAAWKRASGALDEYTSAWRAAHRRVCEAPKARDPAAQSLREQKTSCLGERLDVARAVVANLEHADAAMLEQVPAMLQLLPRVDACEDARAIALLAPPPASDRAAAVDEARRQIAKAAATIAAGRYKEGLTAADEGYRAASATGYLPALAEAYLWVGTAHGRLGHARESEQALDQAVSSASAGRAQPTAVRAWIQLMHFVGYEAKRYDDGARWSDYAKAALESMPGAWELEAERLSWSRAMLLDRKRFDEALAVSRDELALVELRFGATHRLAAAALDGLAGALSGKCKARDALEPQGKACTILEQEFGAPHPQLALCLGNLAALHAQLGDHPQALTLKERALAMFEEVPGHPNHVAMAHRNRVRSLLELGRLADAKRALEAAAALSQRESDETSILLLRGELHRREGDFARARADHEAAVDRTKSGEAARRMDPLVALSETYLASERWGDAAARADEATTIARAAHGEASCKLATPLRARAEALEGGGRAGEALPAAEQALRVLEGAQIDPLVRARAQIAIARALGTTDRARARALAAEARAVVERDGRDPKLLARIDAWLASAP